jgi:hypothetical protein
MNNHKLNFKGPLLKHNNNKILVKVEGIGLSPSFLVQRNSVTVVRSQRMKLSICVLNVKEVKRAPNIFPTQFKNQSKSHSKPTFCLKCLDRESVRASQSFKQKILCYIKVVSSD